MTLTSRFHYIYLTILFWRSLFRFRLMDTKKNRDCADSVREPGLMLASTAYVIQWRNCWIKLIKWQSKGINHTCDQMGWNGGLYKYITCQKGMDETSKESKWETLSGTERKWTQTETGFVLTVRRSRSLVWFLHRTRGYRGFISKALWCRKHPLKCLIRE